MNKANHDIDCARVHSSQGILFPSSPRNICEVLGLNWWAAVKLHADGWLSFNPESLPSLDERQEIELRFVGALVAAGCDDAMLHRLLDGLEKPFCYRPDRVFYDWNAHRWCLLPEPQTQPEAVFSDWLESLVAEGDMGRLEELKDQITEALESANPPTDAD